MMGIRSGIKKLLIKIYANPSDPASFRSAGDLYRAARAKNKSVTRKEVEEFLSGQKSYTLHRRVVRKFPREKIVSYGYLDLIQADLAEMGAKTDRRIPKANKGVKYLLVILEVLSKKMYAVPLNNKWSSTVAEAARPVIEDMKYVPYRCQTDKGEHRNFFFYFEEYIFYFQDPNFWVNLGRIS
jgi:hypothetical protein